MYLLAGFVADPNSMQQRGARDVRIQENADLDGNSNINSMSTEPAPTSIDIRVTYGMWQLEQMCSERSPPPYPFKYISLSMFPILFFGYFPLASICDTVLGRQCHPLSLLNQHGVFLLLLYQLPQNLTEIPTRMTVPLIRMNTRTLSKLHQNHLVREYMPANIVRSCVHVQLWCVGCVH